MSNMAKRILIVDDEAYNYKCADMESLIKQLGMEYEVALTLEDAIEKLFTSLRVPYDAIILDHCFPEKEGERGIGNEGKRLLEMMAERELNIPVMIHSCLLEKPDYDFVVGYMCSWELLKLRHFLDDVRKEN